MPVVNDHRPEDRKGDRWAVVGTDSFMSGTSFARGGASYAAWSVRDRAELAIAEAYVRARSDMRRARIVDLHDYRPKCKQFSIYAYTEQS
jgi:hypothetical protein